MNTDQLKERRDELKEIILASFLETFEHYTDMTSAYEDILFEEEEIQEWKSDYIDEIEEIEEIDKIEEYCTDFDYDDYLIPYDDFNDYCDDLLNDCYELDKLPSLMRDNINWEGVYEDMMRDYKEVTYQGNTYLIR